MVNSRINTCLIVQKRYSAIWSDLISFLEKSERLQLTIVSFEKKIANDFYLIEKNLFKTQIIIALDVDLELAYLIANYVEITGLPLVYGFTSDYWLGWFNNKNDFTQKIIDLSLYILIRGYVAYSELKLIGYDKCLFFPINELLGKYPDTGKLRKKFRDCVGFTDNDCVLLWDNSHTYLAGLEKIFQIVRKLKQVKSLLNIKILIVGNGKEIDYLKKLSFQIGVGSQTYFICQNYIPIMRDIYCASDIILLNQFSSVEQVIDAKSNGLLSLAFSPSLAAGMAELEFEKVVFKDYESQVFSRFEYLLEANNFFIIKRRIEEQINGNNEIVQDKFDDFVKKMFLRLNVPIESDDAKSKKIIFWQETDPISRSRVLSEVGYAEINKGDLEKALSYFDLALQHNAQCLLAICGLGQIAMIAHSYNDAKLLFEKAFQMDSDNQKIICQYGQALGKCGFFDEALSCAIKCLEIDATSPHAQLLFVDLCLSYDDTSKAYEFLKNASIQYPHALKIQAGLGRILIKRGQTDVGYSILQKVGLA